LKPLDLETAKKIIDFSGGDEALSNLAEIQISGAVALHNMIANSKLGMGYLADEVGMGKTYIALGVVTLMRYFNPSLRVLYICPSRNVQDKWDKEYKNFINNNVIVTQYRIRTAEGSPAAPYVSCRNLTELIKMASIGYYADFFVRKDSFSMGLTDDEETWDTKLKQLKKLLPAHEMQNIRNSKRHVKLQYAKALNYILPTFDLVIIDEAHNFKHDFESSDRNRVLSNVFGIRNDNDFTLRIRNSLLLSATPYDRNINQLRNQLKLVGKGRLLPDEIESTDHEIIKNKLNQFMVRRLNVLNINNKLHTRNMYRKEWRTGKRAEIHLSSDEQKLVMALVQKKVGAMLNSKDGSPAYQMGMLASFESFAETTKSPPVEFDGDQSEKQNTDAQDRHVVGMLVDSYKEKDLGSTLPHPKMDTICKQLSVELFENSRKQLVFVRRVKSVKELKDKLDDSYNDWIINYIRTQLENHEQEKKLFAALFKEYRRQSKYKDEDISEGQYAAGTEGDADDNQPPKNDTFFAWFFRGILEQRAQDILKVGSEVYTTPQAVRVGLTAKNQNISRIMELNWAWFICRNEHQNINELIDNYGQSIHVRSKSTDYLDIYHACQIGFLEWYIDRFKTDYLSPLYERLSRDNKDAAEINVDIEQLRENLNVKTFFTEIEEQELSKDIFPLQNELYNALKSSGLEDNHQLLEKVDIHRLLIDICLRTGHGIIDIYIARLKQGSKNLDDKSRSKWIKDLVTVIKQQKNSLCFSTFRELEQLADQFDLIIKNNAADIYSTPNSGRKMYLSQRLNPVSPIIGATGATIASRTAQAIKFRMPGYPLALISTDVFQEGEDLHTFCDSVVHYGLSGTPVSIEQKTGRVDRINSLAQRRLLKIKDRELDDNDLIQVTFPYIKESIEYLQVRQLCENINDFIRSLHEISSDAPVRQDTVDTEQALKNKSMIAEQVTDFLKSPYVPFVEESNSNSKVSFIASEHKRIESITNHVKELVSRLSSKNNQIVESKILESNIEGIKINSARSSGDLILSATYKDEVYLISQNQLRKWMMKKSWNTLHRTIAIEDAAGTYQLFFNSEMLVGDSSLTQVRDIELYFKRFSDTHVPEQYQYPTSKIIVDYYQRAIKNNVKINGNKLRIEKSDNNKKNSLGIRFIFGDDKLERKHNIFLHECDGRCIFISKVATKNKIGQFDDKKIIEYTWIRNNHIDLVEFTLNKQGDLVGRVVHSSNSLDWAEFIFCAYTLAVESDRLEYIIDQKDIF
jgi:hypothetical protein